jgi:hypothetical protein
MSAVSKPLIQDLEFNFSNGNTNPTSISGPDYSGISNLSNLNNSQNQQQYSHGLYSFFAKSGSENGAETRVTQTLGERGASNSAWSASNASFASTNNIGHSKTLTANSRSNLELNSNSFNSQNNSFNSRNNGINFVRDGFTPGGNQGFRGIPNDGQMDPLYDASKHSLEHNKMISDMMTIVNSSSSSEVSTANSITGEKFTYNFSQSLLQGKSLQDTINSLNGKDLGGQTSQAYNTENMSKEPISINNKAHGTAIILRGSDHGVESMMATDEKNLREAYSALGFDVKVVHSEKEFESALLAARDKALEDKANGQDSVLATHIISHGMDLGGGSGHNDANAHGALAMKNGGTYHEKDVIGDIAGALVPDEDGTKPFVHSYNSFTACHSGSIDNEQTLLVNGSNDTQSKNPDRERELAEVS